MPAAMSLPGMPSKKSELSGPSPPSLAHRNSGTFRTTLCDNEPGYDPEIEESEENSSSDSAVVFDDHTCVTVERRAFEAGTRKSNQGSSSSPQIHNNLLTISNAMLSPEGESNASTSAAPGEVDSGYFGQRFTTTTVEEFADAELVNITGNASAGVELPQPSKPKRRLSGLSNHFPSAVKRARTANGKSLGSTKNQKITTPARQAVEDWIVVVDISQIPTYSPSDIMAQRSTRQAILSAMAAQAKAATRTMEKLKRKCSAAVGGSFSGNSRGPTKCVAVGAAC